MSNFNRPTQYNRVTQDQRFQVIRLKEQGFSNTEISQITGINKKTVQSINNVERKHFYGQFELAVVEDYVEFFIDNQNLIGLNKKQQKSLIRNYINKEFIYETSNYQHHLQGKEKSQRKRILDKVVTEILKRFQQHQILKEANQIVNDLGLDDQSIAQIDQFDYSQSLQFFIG